MTGQDPREPSAHAPLPQAPPGREPLDAEERAWADRLGRIGPSDAPSPALDARILAAAHAAAAGSRRRRPRLGWLAVPPALVTGVGVAAAAALALGLVWQLRPRPVVVPAEGEGAGGEDIVVMAEPASARPARKNPPPFVADEGQPAAAPARQAEQSRSLTAKQGVAASAPAQPKPASGSPPPPASTAPSFHPELAGEPRVRTQAGDAATPARTDAAQPRIAERQAAEAESARAQSGRREREAAGQRPETDEVARSGQAMAAAAASVEPAASEADAATMDRIEAADAAFAAIPVRSDRQLEPAAWLERVRARRDQGDLDGARQSLRLFRRDHPRLRIPADLQALLTEVPP